MAESDLRTRLIAEARDWIGTPYRHRASCKGHGTDCLGLVRGVWRQVLGPEPETLPAYAPDWAAATRAEQMMEAGRRHLRPVPVADIMPGDVLLFRWRDHLPAKHAAILVTPQRMVHAHDGAAVAEVFLAPWWRRHLAFAFAFPEA
ncbi:NlpC/P60 family protein [Ancylobacter pratisalsi]|uniref:Peptidase P60 n=1 Tax=Ancylobacter pratisalsi TaxID=1745854 RepID=A0A6P1YQP5_9HYPH|nr:NlpC/P60 family protein [Ancylobacter pratisalsi]QIB35101.1 peptidase P60 [Ancylobacter pratisalsi]